MSRRRSCASLNAKYKTSPFYVYARALHEFFRRHEKTDYEWLTAGAANWGSRMYPILDFCQQEGYHELVSIAGQYRGAFMCDGVGLGKTFIGLMLIESLINRHRKRVALFVPKAAGKPVWENIGLEAQSLVNRFLLSAATLHGAKPEFLMRKPPSAREARSAFATD